MTTRIVYCIFAFLLLSMAVALSIGIYRWGAGPENFLYFPAALAAIVGAMFGYEATQVDSAEHFTS